MRTFLPFLLTLAIPFSNQVLQAQTSPPIEWQKSFGGSSDDEALSVQQTTDGGYVVAGYTTSTNGDVTFNHGMEDYWVLKLDSKGNIQWQKTYGGSNTDIAYCIQQTKEGGYVVAGWSYSNNGDVTGNHGLGDYWIVKLDTAGNITWQKSLGGTNEDWAEYIEQTRDGGYIISGRSKSNNGDATVNHGVSDFWIVKLDSSGNLVWQKSLGGSEYDDATSVRQTDDGGYIATGWSKSTDDDVTGNHGDYDYWVVKLDTVGNLVWEKSYGGSSYDQPYCIRQTTDRGFIIAGFTGSYDDDVHGNHGDHDYWVVKLDTNQNIVWEKCYGGYNVERGKGVEQTPDGGYIVVGWANSNSGNVTGNHGGDDYWIVKIDASGNLTWEKSLGGSSTDECYSIEPTKDDGYVIAGWSASNNGNVSGNHGSFDFWIVKLQGTVVTETPVTSIDKISIYPNPVRDELYLNLPSADEEIWVDDLDGRKIELPVVFENMRAEINTIFLPDGIYTLEIRDRRNGRSASQKFIKED